MLNMKNKSLVTLMDYSPREIELLFKMALDLKAARYIGTEKKRLLGKNIVLLHEKDFKANIYEFEVAAYDQGANISYIPVSEHHMIRKSSIRDISKVIGRIYDGAVIMGLKEEALNIINETSGIPTWNALSYEDNPIQVLADFLTITENLDKPLKKIILSFVGNGNNKMTNALMIGACKMGMEFRVVSPKALWPKEELVMKCRKICEDTGGMILITDNIYKGVRDSDILYTDVWVPTNEIKEIDNELIGLLMPYQINMEMIKRTENENIRFMHCLPSFRNLNINSSLFEMEVTDEVIDSNYSMMFDQAENKMHVIKSVLVATLA
ncbi:ornithine carbamoyltransferase [Clostridium rectalis]|uniref:ornithine carbamoyltransferase n=1 Tax=Clostridium rectalis TaxID=2040295 RepID=UPI000F639008|nr:ornithine carbamoyltransferase [Clostridium rectalis]